MKSSVMPAHRRPMLLKGPYFPDHEDNRMRSEGDVALARETFLRERPSNLEFLLHSRYDWMNAYLKDSDHVVEFGCGAGLSREFIRAPGLVMTDYINSEWVDQVVDAMNPDFENESVDAFICSHMIHHLASPSEFFRRIHPLLRPGGYVLIQEINTSFMMRLMLRVMRHEGWSLDADVFDASAVANNPRDPWSANCSIPQLLFQDPERFERHISGFRVVKNELNECLTFPLSGGVIAKTTTINLPRFVLRSVRALDRVLIALFPGVFALGRSVVLKKV